MSRNHPVTGCKQMRKPHRATGGLRHKLYETVWVGVWFNKYIIFQISKIKCFNWIRSLILHPHTSPVTYFSLLPPFENGVYVCVWEREIATKRERSRKRGRTSESECEREKEEERERKGEREKERHSACDLYVIVTHYHIWVTFFATKDMLTIFSIHIFPTDHVADKVRIGTLPCYWRDPRRHFWWSVKISQADLRLNHDCEYPHTGPAPLQG